MVTFDNLNGLCILFTTCFALSLFCSFSCDFLEAISFDRYNRTDHFLRWLTCALKVSDLRVLKFKLLLNSAKIASPACFTCSKVLLNTTQKVKCFKEVSLSVIRKSVILKSTWGQSYQTFYTIGQIYKLVLKLDNMFWLLKYFVRILRHSTLKYSQSNFFDRGTIRN